MKNPPESIVGEQFHKWIVLEYKGKYGGRWHWYKCLCQCGRIGLISGNSLKTGQSRQCIVCRESNRP